MSFIHLSAQWSKKNEQSVHLTDSSNRLIIIDKVPLIKVKLFTTRPALFINHKQRHDYFAMYW